MEDLQVENGNFTRIVNKVIDHLCIFNMTHAELCMCLFVIRKTWGFNKKEDMISLTQFEEGTNQSRMTVIKSLKNLQTKNIVIQVKQGDRINGSIWKLNKYYDTWKVVNRDRLVKSCIPQGSILSDKKVVYTGIHTKDIIKTNTKTERTLNYLKDIPKEDIEHFRQTFKCDISNIKTKANSLYDYCKAKGRIYKNYKAFLSNALRKDFGERTQPLVIKDEKIIIEKDRTPEEQLKINEQLEKIKIALKK